MSGREGQKVGLPELFSPQTGQIRIYKAELHHLSKQKEKVDEVRLKIHKDCRLVERVGKLVSIILK